MIIRPGLILKLVLAMTWTIGVMSVAQGGGAAAPYPRSDVIADVEWEPKSEIVRKACKSDNWPCTWTDDDSIYTAGGDGGGFGGKRSSLWVCRVQGDPPAISGRNLVSLASGDGSGGEKASSLLMVDGVLYMWVRNADKRGKHCQLAWSADRGQTWAWASWKFEEFGYCTFINYGKNYAGARDGYVYTVTPDNPSAYTSTTKDMILMRVPKELVTKRSAYKFFTGMSGGTPQWSSNVDDRRSVFTYVGTSHTTCRTGISYNSGLGRYLWWQQLAEHGIDTRRSGGFGIYDAPEPWGPWTTVYYTQSWDVGPGETGNFPTKWMSTNGKSCYFEYEYKTNKEFMFCEAKT